MLGGVGQRKARGFHQQLIGVLTVAAPFLLMQPGMGAAIAASKMRKPNVARLRRLMAHSVFGLGLYMAGMFWARVLGQTA